MRPSGYAHRPQVTNEEDVMRRTHVRRGASPRRSRSIRTRRHAMVRHRSARRRGRYGRRVSAPRWSFGKSLMAATVAAAVVLAAASYLMVHHGIRALLVAVDGPAGETDAVAAQFVYTARTANDATVSLPDVVKDDLRRLGLAHQSITLTRVGFDGNVSTSSIDMTPYTGSSSTGPVRPPPPAAAAALSMLASPGLTSRPPR